jgi:SAM-dependent methyltransferase
MGATEADASRLLRRGRAARASLRKEFQALARILWAREDLVRSPERIVPDETEPGIVALHLKRYEFARPHCAEREVLDAGCGVGYGTAFLADTARHVVGVDRSEEAIAYARTRYARTNVEFEVADLLALPVPDDAFDVVCCFETIEHLSDQDAFVAEIRRVLRPGGLFLVSTPRADSTTDAPANPFHERELSPDDFERLLRSRFDDVELYAQRRPQTARHRALQRADVLGLRKRATFLRPLARRLLGTAPMAEVTSAELEIVPGRHEDATELIAVCR